VSSSARRLRPVRGLRRDSDVRPALRRCGSVGLVSHRWRSPGIVSSCRGVVVQPHLDDLVNYSIRRGREMLWISTKGAMPVVRIPGDWNHAYSRRRWRSYCPPEDVADSLDRDWNSHSWPMHSSVVEPKPVWLDVRSQLEQLRIFRINCVHMSWRELRHWSVSDPTTC